MKTCTLCQVSKEITEFNKNAAKKDGLQNKCRTCSRDHSRNYYKVNGTKHRKATLKRGKEYRSDLRVWWSEYKSSLSCIECGDARTPVLDFHHIDPTTKKYRTSNMIGEGYSKETILAELAKCIVLCANCHRMLHYRLKYPDLP